MIRQRRPNVLLVVIDCARADHCSVNGYERETTPWLTRLAEEGTVFSHAFSPAGWSLPAHASLFTGLYPSQHGTHDENHYLDSQLPVLAEELARAGYRTVGFCGNPWVGRATGLDRGFQHFDDLRLQSTGIGRQLDRARRKVRSLVSGHPLLPGDIATARARTAISELARDRQPFFMFVHFNEAHTPRQLPPGEASRFFGSTYRWSDAAPLARDVNGYIAGAVRWGAREFDIFTALYDAALAYIDRSIHELLETLRWERALDNTVVIITADHGENLGEHGLMGHKLCLYDTLLHVPLIVRYPEGFLPGTRSRDLVQTVQIAPTIYELSGVPDPVRPEAVAPESLLATEIPAGSAMAEQFRPSLAVFTEKYPDFDPSPHDRRMRAIRTNEWKFIWSSDGRHELYDLREDLGETSNVIGEHPSTADDLERELTSWGRTAERPVRQPTHVEFDEVVTERLRALGYIP